MTSADPLATFHLGRMPLWSQYSIHWPFRLYLLCPSIPSVPFWLYPLWPSHNFLSTAVHLPRSRACVCLPSHLVAAVVIDPGIGSLPILAPRAGVVVGLAPHVGLAGVAEETHGTAGGMGRLEVPDEMIDPAVSLPSYLVHV